VTPEHDQTAERKRSRLRRLDMTETDERRNSHSRSGTPDRGDNFIPQPVFLPHPGSHSCSGAVQDLGSQPVLSPPTAFVYAPQMQGVQSPVMGDDSFRIYQHSGIINLNDDMPEKWNAPQQDANIQRAASQEGRHPQLSPSFIQPHVPAQSPARVVAGARHVARQPHYQYSTKLWCSKGRH
jgi:phospholipase C